jgi:hypothetical protein
MPVYAALRLLLLLLLLLQKDGHATMLEKIKIWGGSTRDEPRLFCSVYTYHKVSAPVAALLCCCVIIHVVRVHLDRSPVSAQLHFTARVGTGAVCAEWPLTRRRALRCVRRLWLRTES